MPPISLAEPSDRYLCFAEREEIALLRVQGCGAREIARQVGRDPSTISWELRRNAATKHGDERRATTLLPQLIETVSSCGRESAQDAPGRCLHLTRGSFRTPSH